LLELVLIDQRQGVAMQRLSLRQVSPRFAA
jgi:hypothetical protein